MLKEIKGIIIKCLYHGKFSNFVLDFVNSFAESIPLLFYITKRPFLFQTHEKQEKKKKNGVHLIYYFLYLSSIFVMGIQWQVRSSVCECTLIELLLYPREWLLEPFAPTESIQWGKIASLGQRIKFRASAQIDKFIFLYTLILYL